MTLTTADRAITPDPVKPIIPQPLDPPKETGAEERAYLRETLVKPLMDFSLRQEAAKQAETQRAEGVIAKVDAAQTPKRKWWPF